MRVLTAFCLFTVLFSGVAYAETPRACDFDDATYENIVDPDIIFWSEPYTPLSSVLDEGDGIYRFPKLSGEKIRKFFTSEHKYWDQQIPDRSYFLLEPNGERPHILRTYDEHETNSAPYFFFDEKFRRVDTKDVKTAPAYFFMPGMKEIPTAFFRLRNCNIEGVPIPVLRPQDVITSQDCPIERAVFENMKDPTIYFRFEPTTESSLLYLRAAFEGPKTPKRSYLMTMQNGTGLPIMYGTTPETDDGAGILYSYDATGQFSGPDPSTRFVFAPDAPGVPYAFFLLKECKPEAPAPKPAP